MGEEFICKIPNCKCGGRKGRSELEDENAILDNLCDEARLLMSDIAEDPKDYATQLRVTEWNARYKAVEK